MQRSRPGHRDGRSFAAMFLRRPSANSANRTGGKIGRCAQTRACISKKITGEVTPPAFGVATAKRTATCPGS